MRFVPVPLSTFFSIPQISTSTVSLSNQYWSAHGAVLLPTMYQYWSECRPVLVLAPLPEEVQVPSLCSTPTHLQKKEGQTSKVHHIRVPSIYLIDRDVIHPIQSKTRPLFSPTKSHGFTVVRAPTQAGITPIHTLRIYGSLGLFINFVGKKTIRLRAHHFDR